MHIVTSWDAVGGKGGHLPNQVRALEEAFYSTWVPPDLVSITLLCTKNELAVKQINTLAMGLGDICDDGSIPKCSRVVSTLAKRTSGCLLCWCGYQ